MSLTAETPSDHPEVRWNVAKIPGSETNKAPTPAVDYDAAPRLRDMTEYEIWEELSLRSGISAEKKAAAIAYEPIRDEWEAAVEKDVDNGLDRKVAEQRHGPKPKGMTAYELLEEDNRRLRIEARRTDELKQQLEAIENALLGPEERVRRIRDVALADRQKQRELHAYDPDYVYFLPEIFDEHPY